MKITKTNNTIIVENGDERTSLTYAKDLSNYNDEQIELLARLHMALSADSNFFEKNNILDNNITEDVDIYGKRYYFIRFHEDLTSLEEHTIIGHFCVGLPEEFGIKQVATIGVESNVNDVYAMKHIHQNVKYLGCNPITARDTAELMMMFRLIDEYENKDWNNLLGKTCKVSGKALDEFCDDELSAIASIAAEQFVLSTLAKSLKENGDIISGAS